ncbi:MAG: phosphotransferase-like protein [Acidimicrobiia bacterium]
MAASGRLVILNGASSSGKTTLASAFRDERAAAGEFWLLIGIDDFLSKMPAAWLDLGLATGAGAHAHDGLWFETTSTGPQLKIGATCRRLLHAYHHAAAAAARSGLNVIVDDVVIDDDVLGDWLEVLGELKPTWVGVRCSPEITAGRERRRGDRPAGMTGTQTDSVHRSLRYAFEIDTGDLTPGESLDELRVGLARVARGDGAWIVPSRR